MFWVGNEADEEEQDLLFSPALMARRASESWIDTPPIEVSRPEMLFFSAKNPKIEFSNLIIIFCLDVLQHFLA